MLSYSTMKSASRRPTTYPACLQKKEYSSASTIQTKLTVGKPNDKYEQEADRVADQVVSSPTTSGPAIQKKCAACEGEEKAQMQPVLQKMEEEEVQSKQISSIMKMEEEEPQAKLQMMPEEEVQAKTDNGAQTVSSDVSSQIQSKKGGGSPMAESTRNFMESRIGADFSKVRIHNDSTAHKLSAKMNAQAFAIGNNVFFNQGKYNPESQSGKHLLAHELTHTVQQGRSEIRKQAAAPRAKPTLSKTTVAGPVMGKCATHAWKVRWDINGADERTNGWIIQKLNIQAKVKKCNEQNFLGGSENLTYWEGWQVRKGIVYTGNSNKKPGTDTIAASNEIDKTVGSITYTGKAEFFDGLNLPSDFKTNNPKTFAHSLPSTITDPGTLPGGTGSVPHNYKVRWNCCPIPNASVDKTTKLVYKN